VLAKMVVRDGIVAAASFFRAVFYSHNVPHFQYITSSIPQKYSDLCMTRNADAFAKQKEMRAHSPQFLASLCIRAKHLEIVSSEVA
jgi:hypothetical protein